MQQSFDFTGEQLKQIGMQRVAEKAEKDHPGWNEEAFKMLKKFLAIRLGPFQIEDFRQFAEPSGLPAPKNKRAYGPVAVRAANAGLIRKIGYAKVDNPKAHGTPANVWIKNQTHG